MKKIPISIAILFFSMMNCLFAQPAINWEHTFGGSYYDEGIDVMITADGSYLALGAPYSTDGDVQGSHGKRDFWLIKLDQSGQLIWKKTYGGSEEDTPAKIIPAIDGGYLLIGETRSYNGDVTGNHGESDVWLLKVDENGEIIWQKTYGGSKADGASTIIPTNDGGYIIVGYSASNNFDLPNNNHGIEDLWIFKINVQGDIIWTKLYGGAYHDIGTDIIPIDDGGYVVAGNSTSMNGDVPTNHGANDAWVFKIDSIGTLQWRHAIGGDDDDYSIKIERLEDGGYLVFGYAASKNSSFSSNHGIFDFWVFKLNSNGFIQWQKLYGGSDYEIADGVLRLQNGNFLMMGYAGSVDGDLDENPKSNAWLLCVDQDGNIVWKNTYGEFQSDKFAAAKQLNDGGLVTIGNKGNVWITRMDFTTGLNNITPQATELDIAPNPAAGFIDILTETVPENATVLIRSVSNPVMIRQPLRNRRIDVASLPAGMYLLQVERQADITGRLFIKI